MTGWPITALIDQNQKDFLNKSLADGLRDGMREALASPVRKLMKPEDFLAPPPFINCGPPPAPPPYLPD